MPLKPDAVGLTVDPYEVTWTSDESLLYALGVGAGATDANNFELEFTTENSDGVEQKALPTMPVVIAGFKGPSPMSLIGEFNPAMVLHAGQTVTLHRPLPVAGTVSVVGKVGAMHDKGEGKAAIVAVDSVASDASGPLFTSTMTVLIRDAGGFGGERGPSAGANAVPDREPDHVVSYTTRQDQALLYRLSGDRNPLHSDPTFAKMAGFPQPILHGLCTYGFAARAVLHAVCGSDPARVKSIDGRFSKPVIPGQQLDTRIWVDGNVASFQTAVGDDIVFDAGRLEFS